MKVLFNHETSDTRDMLYLDHERCKVLGKAVKKLLKRMLIDDDLPTSQMIEEVAEMTNDIQEYTWCLQQLFMNLGRIHLMSENPLAALISAVMKSD